MPKFFVIEKTEYEIDAVDAEHAHRKWMNSEWDWKLEAEPATCLIYDEQGRMVWEP